MATVATTRTNTREQIFSLLCALCAANQRSSLQAVEGHVESLRAWTYQQLSGLRHSNGVPLLKMFGAHEEGPKHQGGIFQFQVNLVDVICWD
jgi:hypothetical protein